MFTFNCLSILNYCCLHFGNLNSINLHIIFGIWQKNIKIKVKLKYKKWKLILNLGFFS